MDPHLNTAPPAAVAAECCANHVTLWSHAGGRPVHIHWVVQPVTRELMASYDGLYGPHLPVAMFDRSEAPPDSEVEAVADKLRACASCAKTTTPTAVSRRLAAATTVS